MCCSVEGCNNKVVAKGLCSKHYTQMRRFGKILKYSYRDKQNYIEILDDHAEIYLINKDNEIAAKALIDLDDVDKIKEYKWHLSLSRDKYQYVISSKGNTKLHRLIMNAPEGSVVDHINHNPLDNRKNNLRICTNQQNVCNCELAKNNKSGYKGIYWNTERKKWQAQVTVNNKTISLGRFDNIEDAIEARKKAAEEHYGEYCYENYK